MSRHTEGPWEVIPAERGFIVTAKDGQYDIAVVRNIGNEDNEANARLMAASPELLQALHDIIDTDVLSPEGGYEAVAECHCIARAAISKATGEQS